MSDETPNTRGRKPGFRMTEEHRDKIRNSNILHRLVKCAEGEIELNSVQAQVGLGLINKILPNLATTTLQGDEEGGPMQHEHKGTALDLIASRIAGIAARAEAEGSPEGTDGTPS